MIKKFATWIAAIAIVSTVLFVTNQTAQAVTLASTLHPLAGKALLIVLLAFYAVAIAVPVSIWFRVPKALTPPADGEASPDYPRFIAALNARLSANPSVGSMLEPGKTGIERAFRTLDEKSTEIIKSTAATIFLTTAISQNGRLDAIMVLATQSRMIWKITRMYNQRPSLREMTHLYANVGVALFAANELSDLDIARQVEPVMTAAIGSSMLHMVPGASMVASIVTQSLIEGTANAYLTLRVGAICQDYCRSVLTPFDAKAARRSASMKAASMLGAIVSDSAGVVIDAIVGAAKKAGLLTVQSAVEAIREAGANLNPFARPGAF
jgi:hypothetical protein